MIDNRPGAASNIATGAAVRAPADGYTLLGFDAAAAINSMLYVNLNFNFMRDIAPVASVVRTPNVLLVHPSVPANTVFDFISYSKSNPGKLNMGSGGVGTTTHLTGELFKMITGVSLVHVPYRGGAPALMDLVAGQIQVFFGPLPPSIQFIRDGKLRALAVTSAARADALPDIPVVGDFLPGFEANDWPGLGVPAGTPTEIIDRLNNEINAALKDPRIKARVAELGGVSLGGSPADFGTLIAEDTEKWAKVVRFSGRSDLLVTDQSYKKTWSIQVKTNRKAAGFWLLNKSYTEQVARQQVYVFVNLRGDVRPDYYVVRSREVARMRRTTPERSGGSVWYA